MKFDLPSKLALVLLLWVCAFLLDWRVNVVFLLLTVLARFLLPAFRPQTIRSRKAFDKFLLYGFAVVLLFAGVNAFFLKGGTTLLAVSGVELHEEGLLFGLRTATRLLLLSTSILLFFAATPLRDFIHFLQRKGLPPQLVLVLLLALHFLDQLPGRIHQIFVAQEARGAPVRAGILSRTKALFSVVSPLVLASIAESIDRGTALEVRGFLHKPSQIPDTPSIEDRASRLALVFMTLSVALLLFTVIRWLLAL